MIVGSLGSRRRVISRKFGHSAGNLVIIEASAALGRSGSMNAMVMVVVLGERDEGMKGMNSPVTSRNA